MTTEGNALPPEMRSAKHWIIGDPLPSEKLEGQLLPKHLALPIFASDPLSSVAYAPQELVMILMVGGLSLLAFAPWIALAVIVLLVTVVASYRQLIKAYPSGGGYEVASAVGIMIVTGLVRTFLGDSPVAESASYTVHVQNISQAAVILLLLRSCASGRSALTGVEAIANGVLLLALAAIIVLIVFQANLTLLIQLYIIGVFVSFTLGQTGMVKH